MANKKEKEQKTGFLTEDSFSSANFFSPPIGYAPVYTWLWNDVITKEETDRQLSEMQSLGIKRFYILPLPQSFRPRKQPSKLSPDYLTPEYFDQYRYTVKQAEKRGMEVWLYNEGGWPSGGACGKVAENPSLLRECIEKKCVFLRAGQKYQPSKDTVASFIGTKKILKGETFPKKVKITEYRLAVQGFDGSAEIPDLTKGESTESFLALTHEKYAEYIGEYFGKTVTAVFTDEPTAPRPFAYRMDLKEEFFDRYSIDIADYFPYLMGEKTTEKDVKETISKWYEFLSEKFCENYLKKEREWCISHGMKYVGHMDKDSDPSGSLSGGSYDIFRALSQLDVPGVDVISRQLFFPNKGQKNWFFPSIASSVATFSGERHALSESFAVYGNGLTFEQMRYVLCYQAMRGINVFNLMLFSYGRRGFLRSGELPHFASTHACFADLATFNSYLERLSYLFCLGERVAPVALYYPLRDSYVGALGEESLIKAGKMIEKKKVPFDLLPDSFLVEAEHEKGTLSVGKGRYEVVVVPPSLCMSEEGKKVLSSFAREGGKVLCLSEKNVNDIDGALFSPDLAPIFPEIDIDGDGFTVATNRLKEGKIFFVINENGQKSTFSVKAGEKKFFILDITKGKILTPIVQRGKVAIMLFPGEVVGLYFTEESLSSEKDFQEEYAVSIENWTLKRTKRFLIGRDSFEQRDYKEKGRPIRLGDWRKRVGFYYSGSGEYEARFFCDRPGIEAQIDLGKVCYSCEATLNGVSLGVKVMPPYSFSVPPGILQKENTIVVRVTGSVANAFRYTTKFFGCGKKLPKSYVKVERKYDKDSLAGGLFGPVKILYVKKEKN